MKQNIDINKNMIIQLDMHAQEDGSDLGIELPFIKPDPQFANEYRWVPRLSIADGVILDWPAGVSADVFFKPSDDCAIIVDGKNLNQGNYVPGFLRLNGDDDEDYVFMKINAEGEIEGWSSHQKLHFWRWFNKYNK